MLKLIFVTIGMAVFAMAACGDQLPGQPARADMIRPTHIPAA